MPRMNIKGPSTPHKGVVGSGPARFQRRFINGQWTIFDRWNFGHGPGIGTAKEAERIERELNQGGRQWTA